MNAPKSRVPVPDTGASSVGKHSNSNINHKERSPMYELVEYAGVPPNGGQAVLDQSTDLSKLEAERNRLNLASESLAALRYGIRPVNDWCKPPESWQEFYSP
jgi:hypothetical protein